MTDETTSINSYLDMAKRTGDSKLWPQMLGHIAGYLESQSPDKKMVFTVADFEAVLAANPELPKPDNIVKSLRSQNVFVATKDGFELTPDMHRIVHRLNNPPSKAFSTKVGSSDKDGRTSKSLLVKGRGIATQVKPARSRTAEEEEFRIVSHLCSNHGDVHIRDIAQFRFEELIPSSGAWHEDDESMKKYVKTPRAELVEAGLLQTRSVEGKIEYALTDKAREVLAVAIEDLKKLESSQPEPGEHALQWYARTFGSGASRTI